MPRVAQARQERARLLELGRSRPLREIAADHDEIGLLGVNAPFNRLDQGWIMGTEVKVGQMEEASHDQ